MPEEITDDAILNGRLRLFQPRRGHRFGHDAILLAAATPARPGDRVAELGAGVGAAGLALLSRVPEIDLTLVDVDPGLVGLAAKNITRNDFADRASAVVLDVESTDRDFEDAGLQAGSLDRVLMNPPFNEASLQASPDAGRRIAHAAAERTLHAWVRRAASLLRPAGGLTLIWRAEGQKKVLQELAPAFGAVAITPVHPAPGQGPIRILVNACKGREGALRILPPLTLMDQDKRPSAEAEAILRGGMPLPGGDPAVNRSTAPADPNSTTSVRKP